MAEDKKKAIVQLSDIIMWVIVGIALLFFGVMTFVASEPEYPPQNFISEMGKIKSTLNQVGAESAETPDAPSKALIERLNMKTKNQLDTDLNIDGMVYRKPALMLTIPEPSKDEQPAKDLLKIDDQTGQGVATVKWTPGKHDDMTLQRLRWWKNQDFEDQGLNYADKNDRAGLTPDNEKFFDAKVKEAKVDGLENNIYYIFEITSCDAAKDPIGFQKEEENCVEKIFVPGEVKFIPTPNAAYVTSSSLAGVSVSWDSPDQCFEDSRTSDEYPEPSKIKVLVWRWFEDDPDNKKLLTPANEDNPMGWDITSLDDINIVPDRRMVYGIQFYTTESFPDNPGAVTAVYKSEKRISVKLAKTNTTGDVMYDRKTITEQVPDPQDPKKMIESKRDIRVVSAWVDREVYASRLVPMESGVELENRPVIEVQTINSVVYAPDSPGGNSSLLITAYYKLPDLDDESKMKWTRCKLKATAKFGEYIGGDDTKFVEIEGVEFKQSPYYELLRDFDMSVTRTNYKIVGIYNLEFKYSNNKQDSVLYISVLNTESQFKECWAFNLYRERDLQRAREGRTSGATLPDPPSDRFRGANEEERKEKFLKLVAFFKDNSIDIGDFMNQKIRNEDKIWEYSIENEIRFIPSGKLREYPLLKDFDQMRKLLDEGRRKGWLK